MRGEAEAEVQNQSGTKAVAMRNLTDEEYEHLDRLKAMGRQPEVWGLGPVFAESIRWAAERIDRDGDGGDGDGGAEEPAATAAVRSGLE